jgi:inhibitor of KinA sporulation pathway (predicted exonuclease)
MTPLPQIRTHAVIFDLEFTSWEGSLAHRWLRPGEYTELVQIGAVKLDAQSLEIVDTLSVLVRPRVNAQISAYLEKLTGITNAMLDERGVDFLEAYNRFLAFADGTTIFAFGRDDLIFESNLRLYGLHEVPTLPPYTNVIPWLISQGIDPRGMHACDVGPRAGVPFQGHNHDALDDARSVAAGIKALIDKGASNLFLESGYG